MTLPDGYTVRPPTVADAPAIYRLIAAHNTKVVGSPNTTVDIITQGLTDLAFRPESDGWLVLDADGRPVNYGRVLHRTGSGVVGLSVYVPDTAASAWLFRTAVERARRIGAEQGLAEVTLESVANREDQAFRTLLGDNGYEVYTTYYRMRVDHTGEPGSVEPGLRRGPVDEADRRAAYEVMVRAFADQQGSAMRPYDEWVESHERSRVFDWPQLLIVELDGRVAAVCDTDDRFVETDNCGFVPRLGVLPEFRGRGLAKRLLRSAFALDVEAGRTGTILFVDTNNPTPALGLYESVGMRPVELVDVWHRPLSCPPGPSTS
ncbi:GNAT family N-acetyltransferase [Kribbella sp. DT2]|uniref:GNAT family N-acetyltransferase n=1 Tax=Kribbella sp. DT2 TaxID=3393427 RepID=UPI003CFA6F53